MLTEKTGVISKPLAARTFGNTGLFRLPPRGARYRHTPALVSFYYAPDINQTAIDGSGIEQTAQDASSIAQTASDDPRDARARSAELTIVSSAIGGDCWAEDPHAALLRQGLDLRVDTDLTLIACDLVEDDPENGFDAAIGHLAAHCAGLDQRALILMPGRLVAPLNQIARTKGWPILNGRFDPWPLLDRAKTVHCLGGEIGFLALLKGCHVHCYGPSAYTGHGLTDDHPTLPRAPSPFTRDQLVGHILFDMARYTDPFTGLPTQFETIAQYMADWRRQERQNQAITVCCGMSFWKRARIKAFLTSRVRPPAFIDDADRAVEQAAKTKGAIAVWASREPETLRARAEQAGVTIIRVEDGFIRSIGLGADFTPPASVTLDTRGLYFDPARPSDLEVILAAHPFPPDLCRRAAALADLMIHRKITKYAAEDTVALSRPAGKKVIFVPGQVEDDRSIICGGAKIRHNLALLSEVRSSNPDAFILYKPHPDVDAGHRVGVIPDEEILRYADRLERGTPTTALLSIADEVHVITSLVGFEALLRQKKTVVYGRPFYAGWGLTEDMAPIERRTRRLSREALIAGTLILFPRYLDPVTMLACPPEILIDRLGNPTLWRPTFLTRLRRIQGRISRFFAKKVPATPVTMRQ